MSETQKVRIVKRGGFGDEKEPIVFKTEVPDQTAAFAMQIIERWALVAGIPDGEDSAGRAKQRLPTTAELVVRAFDIAEAAFIEARKRGFTTALPDMNEINAKYDAAQAAKDEANRTQ